MMCLSGRGLLGTKGFRSEIPSGPSSNHTRLYTVNDCCEVMFLSGYKSLFLCWYVVRNDFLIEVDHKDTALVSVGCIHLSPIHCKSQFEFGLNY